MFYAFTAAALARFAAADPSWLMAIQRAVAAAGPYVVLALLVIEAALAAFGRSPHPFPPPQTGEG
jgi:hypothetical protein